jgi:hypothetical protein
MLDGDRAHVRLAALEASTYRLFWSYAEFKGYGKLICWTLSSKGGNSKERW